MTERGIAGSVTAALCSLCIPGLGQLLQGRVLTAGLFLFGTVAGLALLVLPGIALWFASAAEAAFWTPPSAR